ncbi:hypothetical protein ZIOFF_037373 [Zingiber officinale]|uniref:Uncharacterized protein n=1 Tax=Zingiber officinale TaxID=94328 RepID=A0A8J5GFV3_ZINOF|nr:hypothetical protein ZIOFF_037373 [Zingiber officinale]
MNEWMSEFLAFLGTSYSPAVEAEGTLDALRASICENLQLYMEENEEDFKSCLGKFALTVCQLLMTSGSSLSRDQLTVTAIKFRTTGSTSVHHTLFGSPNFLQGICSSIIFPNIRLQEEDEELFDVNYIEYIRRDVEGSDIDTRRRIACELLKGVALNYREQVTTITSMQIHEMLKLYATNPIKNWKDKDSEIYLVVALAPKAGSSAGYLVDVESFFTSIIVSELQEQDINASPMLKAGALKFFTVFREKIPKSAVITLLPHLASASDINPFLPLVMTNLFSALQLLESQENSFIMKCIMRVLGRCNVSSKVAKHCIDRLARVLSEVCKNPRNPTFNHYLLESITALIGMSCEKDQFLICVFESHLFPVFQKILVDDVAEFWPYALQIFAQLVDKIPNELMTEGRLLEVIVRSRRLLLVSRTEELEFYVLSTVVENLSCEIIVPHLTNIWSVIFSLLKVRHVVKSVNSFVILQAFWIPNLKLISGAIERKLASVTATRLICESSVLSDDKYSELWGRMLDSIISLLAQPEQYFEQENGKPELPETLGYSAAFTRLHYGGKKEADRLKEIWDPKGFFVTSISRLSSSSPGGYGPVIHKYVDATNQAALLHLCTTYNCAIV